MNRIVLTLLPVAILSSALWSCSTKPDARSYVLNESEIFLAENFQLESPEDFLRDCLFPVAFREKWLGNWETTRDAMRSRSGNPFPKEDLINRLDAVHRECGGSTLMATDYGRLRGIVVLNRSLNQS
ncbi:MAG: hypothetical protein P8J01_00895 [Acidimicrobiales bacterium]|nr:hypothetical protein [Acidimicrobiales bacterium]